MPEIKYPNSGPPLSRPNETTLLKPSTSWAKIVRVSVTVSTLISRSEALFLGGGDMCMEGPGLGLGRDSLTS